MDKEIIQLLKSSNPDDRMEGIERLVESGHPDTIKVLGSLHKQETDPQVKQLAADMARQLKGDRSNQTAEKAKGATRRDPRKAKIYLESAMDAMISFKNDEAWQWARKAFLADPELTEDDYAMGLASEITGAEGSMAVETLLSGGGSLATDEKPKRSEKPKNESDTERVGWGKALAGIGVYAVLNALAVTIPVAIFGTVITAILGYYTDDPSLSEISGGMFTAIAGIAGISVIIAIFIGIFIQYGLIHFAATTFLKGKGYFTNLLWNMRIPLIAQFFAQLVIGGLMLFFLFSAFAGYDYASNTGSIEQADSMINALNGLNGLVSLGFLVWASMIIGKTYEFSGFKGCASIIISSVIMAVTICGCYFIIFMTVLDSIDTSGF